MKLAYFSFHWVVVENAMTTNTIDAKALIGAEAPAVLPSVTSAPSVLMSTQWKMPTVSSYCREINIALVVPLKKSQGILL